MNTNVIFLVPTENWSPAIMEHQQALLSKSYVDTSIVFVTSFLLLFLIIRICIKNNLV